MNLAALRTLGTVARMGSMAAAAQNLNLSAAAVHKQLRQLQQDLGIPLYERTGRGIRLTAACEVLLPYTEGALAQVEAGRQAIEEWRGLRQGMVRLGTGPTLSIHWVPRAIHAFRMRFPSIHVAVETGTSTELMDHARRGQLDLAMVVSDEEPLAKGFESSVRWKSRLSLVTGEKKAANAGKLRDLSSFPFIGPRRGSRLATLTDRYFLLHRARPDTVMRFDNADAARAMLKTGFGWAMLPAWTVKDDIANGLLYELRLKERPPAMVIEMLRFQAAPVTPAVKEFIAVAKRTGLG
jgi:DNA-binding transcriptional LysR family regulator